MKLEFHLLIFFSPFPKCKILDKSRWREWQREYLTEQFSLIINKVRLPFTPIFVYEARAFRERPRALYHPRRHTTRFNCFFFFGAFLPLPPSPAESWMHKKKLGKTRRKKLVNSKGF
jgi:hypothetical protein